MYIVQCPHISCTLEYMRVMSTSSVVGANLFSPTRFRLLPHRHVGLFDTQGFGHSGKNMQEHLNVRIWKQKRISDEDTLGPGGIEDG